MQVQGNGKATRIILMQLFQKEGAATHGTTLFST